MASPDIPGYSYGTAAAAKSPVTLEELAKLEQAVGLTDENRRYLRLAGDVLEDQAEAVVVRWWGILRQQPHQGGREATAGHGPRSLKETHDAAPSQEVFVSVVV